MPSNSVLESLVSNMTISELANRSGKSVEQIVEWALGGAAAQSAGRSMRRSETGRTSAPKTATPRARPSRGGSVDTRTAAGREAYERQVFEAVQNSAGSIGASTLRDQVGGTPLQIRAALNRLIEAGQITYEGRARATRYSAR